MMLRHQTNNDARTLAAQNKVLAEFSLIEQQAQYGGPVSNLNYDLTTDCEYVILRVTGVTLQDGTKIELGKEFRCRISEAA